MKLLLLLLVFVVSPLHAQGRSGPAPLEGFVARVARLWAAEDADGLAALAGDDGRMVLEVGTARGGMRERHAAAALRALFAERESVGTTLLRSAVSGGNPPRGFGELAWTSRARGTTAPRAARVYVGAAWEGGSWRIRELRLLQ